MNAGAQDESNALIDLKSRSRFDSPHSFLLGYSYLFPRWLGGFTLSGTTILRDGTPFSAETPDSPPFGNVDGERNDRPTILDSSRLGVSVDHPRYRAAGTAPGSFRHAGLLPRGPVATSPGELSARTARRTSIFQRPECFPCLRIKPGPYCSARNSSTPSTIRNSTDRPPAWADSNFGQITNTLNAGRIMQVTPAFQFLN